MARPAMPNIPSAPEQPTRPLAPEEAEFVRLSTLVSFLPIIFPKNA